jgi:hypothetical protein
LYRNSFEKNVSCKRAKCFFWQIQFRKRVYCCVEVYFYFCHKLFIPFRIKKHPSEHLLLNMTLLGIINERKTKGKK